jgi:hypothetical protein
VRQHSTGGMRQPAALLTQLPVHPAAVQTHEVSH